jgi:hypothetical protein
MFSISKNLLLRVHRKDWGTKIQKIMITVTPRIYFSNHIFYLPRDSGYQNKNIYFRSTRKRGILEFLRKLTKFTLGYFLNKVLDIKMEIIFRNPLPSST